MTRHASPPARVVVFGAAHEDLTLCVAELPRAGETALSHDRFHGCGGKGANQAAASAAAGARTSFAGVLGDDDRGRRVRRGLTEAGVDLSEAITSQTSATGVAVVLVDQRGSNQIVVDIGASAALTEARVNEVLDTCDHEDLVVTQCEIPAHLVDSVIAGAATRGLRAVVNLAPFTVLSPESLRSAWLIVLNEHEAADALGRAAGDDAATACTALLGTACVVTRGGRGSLAATPDGDSHRVSADHVDDVVDTTGAGDVFVGTLAAALLTSGPSYGSLPAAMRRASTAAAASVGRRGAQPIALEFMRTAAESA